MEEEFAVSFTRARDDEKLLEEWVLTPDSRHGKEGFRVSRYKRTEIALAREGYSDPDPMEWDESYMFFTTLDEAYKAFTAGEVKQGRANF